MLPSLLEGWYLDIHGLTWPKALDRVNDQIWHAMQLLDECKELQHRALYSRIATVGEGYPAYRAYFANKLIEPESVSRRHDYLETIVCEAMRERVTKSGADTYN